MAAKWVGELTSSRCPFTGLPLKLCPVGPNFVIVSEGPGGGWTSTVFSSKAEAIRFLDEFVKPMKLCEPASATLITCPMFESGFDIRELSGMGWTASASDGKQHGYSTTPFWSQRHLEYFLSTRAGVPPVFWNGDLSVRERMPPPPPDALAEETKSRQEAVYAAVDEVVDKSGIESGVVKPRVMVGSGRGKRR